MNVDLPQLAAVAAAMGYASGLRLYLVVFCTGVAGGLGWVDLPPGLALLQHPVVVGASALMLLAEFFADKIPGVDTLWDAAHTLLRTAAGAALAAAAVGGFGGDATAAWTLVAALLGGSLAATAHTAKATTRAAVNTSPEPFSNIGLSLAGDAAVPALLWLAWEHPVVFWPVLAVLVVGALLLVWVLLRFARKLLRRFFPRRGDGDAPVPAPGPLR